jgi:hypothetical protein
MKSTSEDVALFAEKQISSDRNNSGDVSQVVAPAQQPNLDRDYGGHLAQGVDAIELDRVPVHKIDVAHVSGICADESIAGCQSFGQLFTLDYDDKGNLGLVYNIGVDHTQCKAAFDRLSELETVRGYKIGNLMRRACAVQEGFNQMFNMYNPRTRRYLSPILTAVKYWDNNMKREEALKGGGREFCMMVYNKILPALFPVMMDRLEIDAPESAKPGDIITQWHRAIGGLYISMGSYSRMCLAYYAGFDFDLVRAFEGCVRSPGTPPDIRDKFFIDTHSALNGNIKPIVDTTEMTIVVNDSGYLYNGTAPEPIDVINREEGVRRLVIFPKIDYYGHPLDVSSKLRLGRMRSFFQQKVKTALASDVSLIYFASIASTSRYHFIGFDTTPTMIMLNTDRRSGATIQVTPCCMFLMYSMIDHIWRLFKGLNSGDRVVKLTTAVPVLQPAQIVKMLCISEGFTTHKESISTAWEALDIAAWIFYTMGLPRFFFEGLNQSAVSGDIDFGEIWEHLLIDRLIFFMDYEVMALVRRTYIHPDAGRIFISKPAMNALYTAIDVFPSELCEVEAVNWGRQLRELVLSYSYSVKGAQCLIHLQPGQRVIDCDDFKNFHKRMLDGYVEMEGVHNAHNPNVFYEMALSLGWIKVIVHGEKQHQAQFKKVFEIRDDEIIPIVVPKVIETDLTVDKDNQNRF